ncbi:Membrane alanine aminopeptidase N [hydrothermal vent metagenome]|uniref:Membrane alanine aminopeptidase N n=1 Tax=hydrothermal vent metagenome TaxID=652676 RepID=A0A3B0W1P1_9ZZZZ
MIASTPDVHYLKDYQPPEFAINTTFLEFDLHPVETVVKNTMQFHRLSGQQTLTLLGEDLVLLSVLLNGKEVIEQCHVDDISLSLEVESAEFELVVVTKVSPERNTALEGLYRTSGNYCTQCEAEGFRKITYFLDRPDVLTRFTTKIIADKNDNSVLLSNGNLIEWGDLADNRHYAVWEDPFKKPSYLFALVAGNLAYIEDTFLTVDQREIVLRIYVEGRNLDKCAHAMTSLKKSMAWDEQRFGLIYDLDIYMIVAVDDFNMGAMENKGLNVFNSKFVLAKPETATDVDYEGIEAVIAHEYFHNWTGNRVTCRDWFQLTLKEGLTVFRDQEFTADMLSPAVKRIEDVKRLRSNQFPEDAGPMSHPIQPQSYIEMNNFYTMTVYEKGAEVVRLYHTLLGEVGFRKGMDLYFKRHDGQAVTVVDFRKSMEDANHVDLTQLHHWYIQAGTPTVEITTEYDMALQTYQITCHQKIACSTDDFQPLLIPIRFGLLSKEGEPMVLVPDALTQKKVMGSQTELLLQCCTQTDVFTFTKVTTPPIPAFLKGFSAPIHLKYRYTDWELSLLARSDSDSFIRWESFQILALNEIKENIHRYEANQPLMLSDAVSAAFLSLLQNTAEDKALIALTIILPDLTYIGEQFSVVNPDAVYHVHQWLRKALAQHYKVELSFIYQQLSEAESGAYQYHKEDIGCRKLKNACLRYLTLLPNGFGLAKSQYERQHNMTDVLAALEAISHTDHVEREACLQDFYDRWYDDALVLDKWFSLQAASHHRHALEHVKALVEHKDFVYTNPNRVRSVLGIFGRLNLLGFHRSDGQGYVFLAEQVIKLDGINPQVAARIVAPFTHWKRYDEARGIKMKKALNHILNHSNLSKDVYEIVSKSLS